MVPNRVRLADRLGNSGAIRLFRAPLLAVLLIAACTPIAQSGPTPTATPLAIPSATSLTSSTPPPPPSPSPSATAPTRVFVVVMENTPLAVALRSPLIARLASSYALATNYHAVASPSLPNYLALTSGSTWGITDDAYHVLPARGLGAQLTAAGVTWRAYMEGMTQAGCLRSPYPYAVKHNPFAYYGGGCPENVVALDALESDLAGATPSFVWITPDLCHDGHDCALSVAGPW